MYRRIVYALIDAVSLGFRVKPVQEAIRRIIDRYRIRDERWDRRISGIVYNVYRWQGLLEHIISKELGDIDKYPDNIRAILLLTTYINLLDEKIGEGFRKTINRYSIRYLYDKTNIGDRERVKEYIKKLSKKHGWKPESIDEEIMYKYRVSPEFYRVLTEAFKELGENPIEFLEYTLKPPPRVFRVNTLKASPKAIIKYLHDLGLRVERGKYSSRAIRIIDGLHREVIRLVETGILIPQDESSMVAVELLDPKPGSKIADLCAAPGGKTTYLAEYTGLRSRIYSFEIYRDRARRLRLLLERTGTSRVVRVFVEDARRSPEMLGRNSVDYVLLDPPCTSSGALARNPDVRWRFKRGDLSKLVELQRDLLEAAWLILRRGGRLMYTVCSVLPWEGEYVVKKFLNTHSDARIIPLDKPFTQSPILPGTLRAYPHRHGVVGFYYALLSKE